mmetsp:Transcript_32716/g.52097  ORF Transcript_32716/g.52097 Transcript_32716/m.52097 type:complete len:512 (+) Transcript_32716:115-1650(+)
MVIRQSLFAAFSNPWRSRTDTGLLVGLLCASLICVCIPFELDQLIFALLGAISYVALQKGSRAGKTRCQREAEREYKQNNSNKQMCASVSSNRHRHVRSASRSDVAPRARVTRPDVFKISALPVLPPKFDSCGFDAEVHELVKQLTPNADEIIGVERLAQYVQEIIQEVLPQAGVTAFVHGSLKRGTAFSVAVPELDLVTSVPLAQLMHCCRGRLGLQVYGVQKCKKSAIRACTDRLLAKGGMRFRRSAFKGEEPRMTLLIMPELGFFTEGVPVDFSINALMPFYTSALLTESGKIEPRAKAIMLFVKRWAKDRGICHVAKGHLSPYVWSLLVMYFMQVREDGPLLPALENSQLLSSLRLHTDSAGRPQFHKYGESAIAISASGGDVYACQPSLGRLFLEFVKFYSCAFEWNNEAINVRLGRRARPDPRLPCVVFDSVVDQQKFAPAIEDPLSDHQNLSGSMNAVSLSRLHEELRRAVDLCERGASLTELLTPWAPEAENLVDDAVSDKDA